MHSHTIVKLDTIHVTIVTINIKFNLHNRHLFKVNSQYSFMSHGSDCDVHLAKRLALFSRSGYITEKDRV